MMNLMQKMLRKKLFIQSIIFFVLINILLYLGMFFFHNKATFRKDQYLYNAHHFFQDNRILGGKFHLLRALGNYDAQWYLRIAQEGYPNAQQIADPKHRTPLYMGALTYAFFPFYPLMLHILNFPLKNIELSAFIFANILMLANFISLYYFITKLYSEKIAQKTIFLMFLYPFSIFYRSYFTEGLFLFLLIWFSYFLIRKRLLPTAICIALLYVTRPMGIFLAPIFLYYVGLNVLKKKIPINQAFAAIIITVIPFIIWTNYNYTQTYDYIMWHHVEAVWYKAKYPLQPIVDNTKAILSFDELPFHDYRQSKVDTGVFLVFLILSILSRKYLKKELWLISITLILAPFFVRDFMSYSRYALVGFPLFIYVAAKTNKYFYITLLIFFSISLFITSIYFVNWYWIG